MIRFLLSFVSTLTTVYFTGEILASVLMPRPLKYYHTTYMRIAIPGNWSCGVSGTEHICGPNRPIGNKSEAIIILTAKESGPQDTLENYRRHLAGMQSSRDRQENHDGVRIESINDRLIGGRAWVVASASGSELPGYKTVYFGTVAGDLSVLVTFSAVVEAAGRYDRHIIRLLESLKLYKKQ